MAGDATQQDLVEPLRAVRPTEQDRRWCRHAYARSARTAALYAGSHSDRHVDVTVHEPPVARGRVGQLSVALRQLRAARRWLAQRQPDLRRRAVLTQLSE